VEPAGAHVIAVDQHGRPALLRNQLGDGQAILCTYPIEHMAAVTAAVNPDATVDLYRALAAVAGVAPDISVDSPDVIVGELNHADGRQFVWLINMADHETSVAPKSPAGVMPIGGGDPVHTVALPPFGVEVLQRSR
jgi:hypothetical protein